MSKEKPEVGLNKSIGGPRALIALMLVLVGMLVGGMWLATQTTALDFLAPNQNTSTASSISNLTPPQLLAVGDGRGKDDPEMAAAFARLDAACPEDGERVADIATNFKTLVQRETGQTFPMIYLMDKLADAQSQAAGRPCVETGALYATIIGK